MKTDDADDLKTMLDGTDPGTKVHVPDELLTFWFPPGVRGGRLDPRSLDAIMLVANQTSCVFEYLTEDESGCFTKLARC